MKIKGISKLPQRVQTNIKRRFLENSMVETISVERVSKDELYQPDLYDRIRVIGWNSQKGYKYITEIAEYALGVPTVESFWLIHTS